VRCGQLNHGLKADAQGASLLDFMEDEPLRRAFRDGVDPVMLATTFVAQFDITKFGIKK